MVLDPFAETVRRQTECYLALTPTERFDAYCDLMDSIRELAASDPEAKERRIRAREARQREREACRAYWGRLADTRRNDDSQSP